MAFEMIQDGERVYVVEGKVRLGQVGTFRWRDGRAEVDFDGEPAGTPVRGLKLERLPYKE